MMRSLVLVSWCLVTSHAFLPSTSPPKRAPSLVVRNALWRHFIPRGEDFISAGSSDPASASTVENTVKKKRVKNENVRGNVTNFIASAFLVGALMAPLASLAVSGGGLDFANLDLTGQDFSNNNYKGKDFSQVIAKGTNFAKSNLVGCRFFKAYLVNANFAGADMRGASLEDTSMDGAVLKDAVASGAYFSASLIDAGSLENVDFTDAQIPIKTIPLVCEREDVKGANPVTGADTRDSLMCP